MSNPEKPDQQLERPKSAKRFDLRCLPRRKLLPLSLAALVFLPGVGNTKTLSLPPYELTFSINGIDLKLPVTATVMSSDNGGDLPISVSVGLQPLFDRLNDLVNSAWATGGLAADGRVEHRGTGPAIEAGALRVKVHFRVDPPVLPSSNGSVVALFTAVVSKNTVGLQGHVAEFNISNDLTRNAAELTGFDDKAQAAIQKLLTELLSRPQSSLALPPAAAALGVSLTNARFAKHESLPYLEINGFLPAAAANLMPW